VLSAKGGAGKTYSSYTDRRGGAGGGGRIAVHYDDGDFIFDAATAQGGDQGQGYRGGAGTIFVKNRTTMTAGLLLVDNGDLTGASGPLPRIKFDFVLAGLDEMGYDAINVGPRDVAFGMDALRSAAAGLTHARLVSANLLPAGLQLTREDADWPCAAFVTREVSAGGRTSRVAVLGVMSDRFRGHVRKLAPDARLAAVADTLPQTVRAAKAEADFVVLLAQMLPDEVEALGPALAGIDVVICGHDRLLPEQVSRPPSAGAGPVVLLTGQQGRYVGTLPLGAAPQDRLTPGRFAFEIMDGAFPLDAGMEDLILDYRTVLRDEDMLGQIAARAGRPEGDEYLGSEACGACHVQDLTLWRHSMHAHALATLERLEQNKEFDPECVVCHVVGLGYQSGFVSRQATPRLVNVGCESCHGAGWRHVADPTKPYNKSNSAFCSTRCHTAEHSTHFDFKRDWPPVRHGVQKVGRKRSEPPRPSPATGRL